MVLCDTGSVVPSGVEQRYWGDRTSSSPLPTFFVDSDKHHSLSLSTPMGEHDERLGKTESTTQFGGIIGGVFLKKTTNNPKPKRHQLAMVSEGR
jgi:hypothetical protein